MNRAELETRKFPLNLQFFADGEGEGTDGAESGAEGNTEPQAPTIEQLMAELAKQKAEATKLKATLDKTTKERGDLAKALKSKQTAEEQKAEAEAEAKAQADQYIKDLETFKRTAEAQERYTLQGMNADMAKKAAAAEIEGDMDALSQIQKQHFDARLKEEQAKWRREVPQVNSGNGYAQMTMEEIMAITDPVKQREAIAQNLRLFR